MIVPVDSVKLAIDYSQQNAYVRELFDRRVTTRRAASPTYPCATVNLVDTEFRDQRAAFTTLALLDVNVWAATESAASYAARLLLGAFMEAPGFLHHSGTITNVELISGPQHLPDEVSTPVEERFVFTIQLTAHP